MTTDTAALALTPWAATLPSDWQLSRIDDMAEVLFSNVDKHTLDDEEPVRLCNYVDVYKNDRITRAINFMEASAEPREITKFQIQRGDVLSTKDSETPDDIAISALVDDDLPGVLCGYHLAMMRPGSKRLHGPFLAWTHASKQFRAQYEARAVGVTRFGLPQYAFRAARLPLPPRAEQERIASYLDATCAAIDAAVATKRQQIETLDALARDVLHRAFSNVAWPKERIKDLASKIGSGVTPEGGATSYMNRGIPLLRSQNVHFDGLRLDDVAYISKDTHAEMSNSQIKPRDVLLNITGASIGRCTVVPEGFGEGNVNQHVCIIRGNHRIDHRFMSAFLSSPMGQGQVFSAFTGASRQGLSHKELGLIEMPLPSIHVQHEVVADIELTKLRQRRVRENISAQIDALRSYRNSLIHECVTGQRRVTEGDLKRAQARG